jgi:hypothetical protein
VNDSLDEFESELSRLTPARLPAEVTARIASQLDRAAGRKFADRCLMTFIGCGALAASVIVCLIGWQMIEDGRRTTSPPSAAGIAAQTPPPTSIAAYQQALARSDGPTLELFR